MQPPDLANDRALEVEDSVHRLCEVVVVVEPMSSSSSAWSSAASASKLSKVFLKPATGGSFYVTRDAAVRFETRVLRHWRPASTGGTVGCAGRCNRGIDKSTSRRHPQVEAHAWARCPRPFGLMSERGGLPVSRRREGLLSDCGPCLHRCWSDRPQQGLRRKE